ncbi:MAG: hypothetical protein ACLSGS_02870 [Adlercreutzia sp.]
MACERARALLGPDPMGVSTQTVEQARAAGQPRPTAWASAASPAPPPDRVLAPRSSAPSPPPWTSRCGIGGVVPPRCRACPAECGRRRRGERIFAADDIERRSRLSRIIDGP